MNRCDHCGATFDGRADARFCSDAHRSAAGRAAREYHRATVERLLLQAARAHVQGTGPAVLDRVADETSKVLGVSLRRELVAA